MKDPYQVLGVKPGADLKAVRAAYHAKAKRCHPDLVQDPVQAEAAQQALIELNAAYEAVQKLLALNKPRAFEPDMMRSLSVDEAKKLAEKMLKQHNATGALYHLQRADAQDAEWFGLRGEALMQQRDYAEANEAFREALRLDPSAVDYKRRALDAAIAREKSKTFLGQLKRAKQKKKSK